ncbi:MAG TPA: hypothetical protein DEO32_00485 [Ruminococcaceae bacterium]|nr:hypothetical protein [Oscillospiraceae bacterium]
MVLVIVFAIVGIYSIFTGVKILLTGQLTVKEEAKLKSFSNKGSRTYKLAYSVSSILGGLLVLGLSALSLLEEQKILTNTMVIRLVVLGAAVATAIGLMLIRKKCEKMTDDE